MSLIKKIVFPGSLLLLWLFLSVLSFNHLYPFPGVPDTSTFFLGVVSWITIIGTLLYLSRQYFKPVIIVFFSFFTIAFYLGPFLEAPGDPIDHLHNTYTFCGEDTSGIRKINSGFWHYSMSSTLLCSSIKSFSPEAILRRIDFLHGVYCGLMAVGLFILSKSAGLPDRWAYLSGVMAFLFLGTNRFSYFSYYSLAPGFSSLLIYWLWTTVFFFKHKGKDVVLGLLMGVASVPILVVNHIQEAIFLGFLVFVWLFILFSGRIWGYLNRWSLSVYIVAVVIMLYLLPQFNFFQDLISPFFIIDDWEKNQAVVFQWRGIHIMGKIWSFRVGDTLGLMGILPIFLGILMFWPGLIEANPRAKINIFILGILPLLIYTIPLFHFIWVSNCKWKPTHIKYYYRICYASMFWIITAFVMYGLEKRFATLWNRAISLSKGGFFNHFGFGAPRSIYFALSLALMLVLGGVRSAPVYGKLDFLLLKSKPWWPVWKPMIEDLIGDKNKPVYTDQLTSNVINGVFNLPTKLKYRQNFRVVDLNIKAMGISSKNNKNRCVINLTGFTSSWVSRETRHWSPKTAATSHYYHYRNTSGMGLKPLLKQHPPVNCDVYE